MSTYPPLLFLRKFLREGTRVASVAPSSRSLGRAMSSQIDPRRPQTIVELGAGSGAVTRIAAERMHPQSRLIAVEVDPEFHRVLAADVPAAEAVLADVRELPAQLAARRVQQVDLVIDCLPTPSLPRAINAAVFDWLASLAATPAFSQMTVMPWVYRPLYQRLFHHVEFELVLANVPPGGVYHCAGLQPDWQRHLPGR